MLKFFQGPAQRLKSLLGPSQTKSYVLTALLIGLSAAVMVFIFEHLIHLVQKLFMGHRSVLDWAELPMRERWQLLLIPALGGLLVGPLTTFFAPEAKGDGVPEVIVAINKNKGRIRGRVGWIKAIASALTLGSGGSAGREGPMVQMGASIGSTIGHLRHSPPEMLRTMAAAGAAGGIAAAFNAPLAGVFFALEVILTQFNAQAFSIVVLASVIASFTSRALSGNSSYFFVPSHELNLGIELALYGILGIMSAIAAQLFMKALAFYHDTFEKLTAPEWAKPALGGLLVGLLAFCYPQIMGTSHEVVELGLKSELPVTLLGILLVGKLFATSWTLGSGGSGGVFMPSLVIGALLGGWFGGVMENIVPGIASPGAYATVGMAACFGAMTHAPMTAILILFEMTYDYGIILPVMTATVLAVMASNAINQDTVYEQDLKRRGITLKRKVSAEVLEQIRVAEVMSSNVQSMQENESLEDITHIIEHSPHTGFPVVNAYGDLVGLLTYNELHQALENQTDEYRHLVVAKEIMREKPPRIYPQDYLQQALDTMERQHVDRLPVVDPDDPKRLIGIITKGDIALFFHKLLNTSK